MFYDSHKKTAIDERLTQIFRKAVFLFFVIYKVLLFLFFVTRATGEVFDSRS